MVDAIEYYVNHPELVKAPISGSRRPWAANEKYLIPLLVEHGYTHEEIGEALKRTAGSITKYCYNQKIRSPRRPPNLDQVKKAVQILKPKTEENIRNLAEFLNVSVSSVRYHNRKYGENRKKRKYTEKIEELAGKYPAKQIAESLGMSEKQLRIYEGIRTGALPSTGRKLSA